MLKVFESFGKLWTSISKGCTWEWFWRCEWITQSIVGCYPMLIPKAEARNSTQTRIRSIKSEPVEREYYTVYSCTLILPDQTASTHKPKSSIPDTHWSNRNMFRTFAGETKNYNPWRIISLPIYRMLEIENSFVRYSFQYTAVYPEHRRRRQTPMSGPNRSTSVQTSSRYKYLFQTNRKVSK